MNNTDYRKYTLIFLLLLIFSFTTLWVYDGFSDKIDLNYQPYLGFLEVMNKTLMIVLGGY